ncbi:MAG TPA: hypothetical protein VHW01_13935 [Polyangiaceae bacterium]|nr:hypothetical protein [Polyangiaceae bacterium]
MSRVSADTRRGPSVHALRVDSRIAPSRAGTQPSLVIRASGLGAAVCCVVAPGCSTAGSSGTSAGAAGAAGTGGGTSGEWGATSYGVGGSFSDGGSGIGGSAGSGGQIGAGGAAGSAGAAGAGTAGSRAAQRVTTFIGAP